MAAPSVVHIARAFIEPAPKGTRGRRWQVDGLSLVTGSLHLVSGKLERTIALADLLELVSRGIWQAESDAEARPPPPALSPRP